MSQSTIRGPLWLEELFEGRLSSKVDSIDGKERRSFRTLPSRRGGSDGNRSAQRIGNAAGSALTRNADLLRRTRLLGPTAAEASSRRRERPSGTEAGGSSGVMGGPTGTAPATPADLPSFDGLLVSWQPGSSAAERAQARRALGLSLRETIQTAAMLRSGAGPIEWLDLPAGLSAEAAIARLQRRAGVAYAEPNWLLAPQAISNDPYVTSGDLWGMAGGFGIRATDEWAKDRIGSNTVYIGIIDEGYQFTHPDLVDNAGVNPGETAGDGIDNDGNGYVDDIQGWDFDGGNNSVYDGSQDDHGTHVAGTIGARGGNGIGVAGVSWNVKLLNAKFLGRRGGTTANAIKSVDYFTDLKTRHNLNIVATNNSWGGGGFSLGLQEAIARAAAADILFIAAAGNDGTNNDTTIRYPSSYPVDNVIAVASITSSGALSSFSNFGQTSVDLGAPGSAIWSTVPTGSYNSYSGTSMATPHVSGAAALLKSIVPSATAAQIKEALLRGTIATPSLSGRTVSGGRLDVPTAVQTLINLTGGGGGGMTQLPSVAISVGDANASETNQDPGSFSLTRSGGDPTTPLTVQLAWGGSAGNGTDYSAQATSVTFAPDQISISLPVVPVDDADFEGPETVILGILAGTDYGINGASSATINLADNDPDPNPPSYDPIINFQGSRDLFNGTRQMFLDGSFNTGFGQASYAATTSAQAFNLNGGDVLRVKAADAGGQPYRWFFSSKYSLNGVNGLAVFLDLGTTTNLAGGKAGAEDDMVAFLSGWTYAGKAFLGTPDQVSWLQVVA